MKKQLGAICLLAGTAIGSGMISLPIVLAKCGIFISCLLFFIFSIITYVSSIIRCDLNINSHASNSLSDVGKIFGNDVIRTISDLSIKSLMFALLAAYIFGLSSILCTTLNVNQTRTTCLCILGIFTLLHFPTKALIQINKHMFILLIITFILMVVFLTSNLSTNQLPTYNCTGINVLPMTIPVIFTSFGFQGSLHNMTSYVNNDINAIKKACFWGSLIPAIVYTIWTVCILTIVFNTSKEFFFKMISESVDVGELIEVLASATNVLYVRVAFYAVSICSIITSLIGVSLSLFEPFEKRCSMSNEIPRKTVAGLKTVLIPSLIALIIPNAFIKILNFSGILLAIIALIIPCVLRLSISTPNKDTIIKNRYVVLFTLFLGIVIICFGL